MGCYGPGRPVRTAARLGTRRARIGAAPAPGSHMCRGGRDPLPTPRGVLRPTTRGEAESPAPRGRPLSAEQLRVQTRGSRLPAPRPRAPASAPAPAPAPAGAPASACAAAATGREGKGGSRRRPRLPMARAAAKVSAAASARAPGLLDARSLTHSHALTGGGGSARSSARCLSRSVRGSRLTPERGGRKAAPSDDVSRLATVLLPLPSPSSLRLPLLAFSPHLQPPRPGRLWRVPMTHQGKRKSRSASGWVRLGPRDCCCCRRRGRRRLYGRVRTEERKGRSPGKPKLPPDPTHDLRAARRGSSVAVSSGAGADCSSGSKEEAGDRARARITRR